MEKRTWFSGSGRALAMGTTWSRGGRKKGPKQNLQKRLSCSMDVVPDMPGDLE